MDQVTFAPIAYTPAPAPLSMPEQSLHWYREPKGLPAKPWPSFRVMAARSLLVGTALFSTVFAVIEMHSVVTTGGVAAFEWVLIGVFAIAFAWIAVACGTALAGILFPWDPKDGPPLEEGLTALVMPVYNEDPRDTFAALAAMVSDLPDEERETFEVFILSDTTNPETWVAEERALAVLRRLAGPTRVWYRRRRHNTHRKAGNVADFVRRWGARYKHMVVLDADSLMTGACLVSLRHAMMADPKAGIIQTAPTLIGATTAYARAQQFANTVTGPVVAEGVAAWQGEDGNYWGHNAIIRMEAFASAAGLPQLPGKPPFGGTILSHDFVEAALIRRAGWRVTMRPQLTGSYEGAPNDLFGVIKRDRRWAQGNLQHGLVMGAAGLKLASRIHFGIGIFAYLMSPVWLLLILTGVALSIQATFVRPEYFPDGFALFPTWPAFDTEKMIRLFLISMAVLLLPKILGLLRALFDPEVRRGSGGVLGLVGGFLVELVISTFIAPIMMLAQTGIVLSIMLGRAVGWVPQARKGASIPWRQAAKFHAIHTLVGIGLGLVAFLHSRTLAAWMAPTLLALVLAIPVSKVVGSQGFGRSLRRLALMLTPQETSPPDIVRTARRLAHHFPAQIPQDALMALASEPPLAAAHRRALEPGQRGRGSFDADTALVTAKLGEAHGVEELASWLSAGERMSLLNDPALLDRALALGQADGSVRAA